MVHCAVVGCNSSNKKQSCNYKPDCRYFGFPKNKSVCREWVHKCYRKNKFNIETARICSEHFTDDDYCLKEKLLNLPRNKWKLKPEAIPSINLVKEAVHDNKREERLKRRRLIKSIKEPEQYVEYITNTPALNIEKFVEVVVDENVSVATQTESSEDTSEKLRELRNECRRLQKVVEKQKAELQAVQKIFTPAQLRKLKSGRQVTWTVQDIASAISLYEGGPRAYRLLRKRKYPLPGVSTLQRWARKVNVQTAKIL